MDWTETSAGGMARSHGAGKIVIHRHGRVIGKWQATILPDGPLGSLVIPFHSAFLLPDEQARSGWDFIEQAKAEIDERFPVAAMPMRLD